ncbi:MAG: phospho-N-acetylmuramoyl-pentapeptide-transferase, partial [Flavobacteriaceae bacterium]|nr:phospho-N-acetylmuramoyl-pentapeptide-transferase [Flavobacteriaceae bacterium]
MLYYLFEYLEQQYQVPGAGLFGFLSFRAAMATISSLLIATVFGKRIILYLQRQQIGESIRELGLEGQTQKAGTPTMGGIIIILATLVPVVLFAKIKEVYIVLLIITTVWMGIIGFIDDYIKTFKKDKEGLKGIFKVVGQVILGLIVGTTLYFHPGVTLKSSDDLQRSLVEESYVAPELKSTATTIPFVKNNELDYSDLIAWIGDGAADYAWLIFIPVVIFIVTAVSNGANLTDGIDGLAAGTSAIIAATLAL